MCSSRYKELQEPDFQEPEMYRGRKFGKAPWKVVEDGEKAKGGGHLGGLSGCWQGRGS